MAKLRWSKPLELDQHDGIALAAVACPTTGECAVLDGAGRYVVINPGAGTAGSLPPAHLIAGGLVPTAVACPSASQCTAVFTDGHEYTFDPATQRSLGASAPIDTSATGISCPTAALCVVTDSAGNVVTFDPSDPDARQTTALDPGVDFGLVSVSCVSVAQCTAISQTQEVTFAPLAPAGASVVKIDANGLYGAVACPALTQCTMASELGTEVTFNPQTATADGAVKLDSEEFDQLSDLSCPSATVCATVSQGGSLISFDPQTGVKTSTGKPTTDELYGVSCPTATGCVAVDDHGLRWTFDPSGGLSPKSRLIDHGTPLGAITCASASQCTAVDASHEISFNPLTRRVEALHILSNSKFATSWGLSLDGVACVGAKVCTAVGPVTAYTFNPVRFSTPGAQKVEQYDSAMSAIRCPARTECVTVDSNGYGVVYNPLTHTRIRFDHVEVGAALGGVSCPSGKQCTAVDNDGMMVSFQPLTGKRIAIAKIDRPVGLDAPSGDSTDELDAVSCVSVTRCVAVDTLGNVITFNPRATHGSVLRTLDPGHALTSVSCHGATMCVTVDSAGRAWLANLAVRTWTADNPAGAASLSAVACVSAHECVAVDSTGAAFIARL
jgi:hypothetical protein